MPRVHDGRSYPKKDIFRRLCLVFILSTIMLMGVLGCGRKEAPVPPGTLVPERVNDLSFKCKENAIELFWSVPKRNTDGSPIQRLDAFYLYKAEIDSKDACIGCPVEFGEPIEISYGLNPESKKRMYYEDRVIKKDKTYIYEVVASKGIFGKSASSNRVIINWHPPPQPPKDIEIKAINNKIHLKWSPPEYFVDGTKIDRSLNYRIYSLDYNNDWQIVGYVLGENSFIHREPYKIKVKKYRITTVYDNKGTLIESEPSLEVQIGHIDKTPPNQPKGLVVIQNKTHIELYWQQNTEDDLAGYYIYRVNPDNLIDRLNEYPIKAPRFIDEFIGKEGVYTYFVTAVDDATPPNESKPSNLVRIEYKR